MLYVESSREIKSVCGEGLEKKGQNERERIWRETKDNHKWNNSM